LEHERGRRRPNEVSENGVVVEGDWGLWSLRRWRRSQLTGSAAPPAAS
jgi:hypothetical protein